MKLAKAIRRQAKTAERAALNATDAVIAGQMRNLAQAFRVQAEIIKKIRRARINELLHQSDVRARRTLPPPQDLPGSAQKGSRAGQNWLLRRPYRDAGGS
jgi:hypothetical protein